MQMQIVINMNGAAFEDAPLAEVARILEEEAKKMRRFSDQQAIWANRLTDINGNPVGTATTVEGG